MLENLTLVSKGFKKYYCQNISKKAGLQREFKWFVCSQVDSLWASLAEVFLFRYLNISRTEKPVETNTSYSNFKFSLAQIVKQATFSVYKQQISTFFSNFA